MELVIDLHPAKSGPTIYLKISETLHSDEIAPKTKGLHEENSSRLDLRAKRHALWGVLGPGDSAPPPAAPAGTPGCWARSAAPKDGRKEVLRLKVLLTKGIAPKVLLT